VRDEIEDVIDVLVHVDPYDDRPEILGVRP